MTTTLFLGMSPLVLFIAKATLVLIAGLVAAFALRHSTAGARHLVWLAVLVGVLALPVLGRIPSLRLAVLPATIGDARIDAPSLAPTTYQPTERSRRAATNDVTVDPRGAAPAASLANDVGSPSKVNDAATSSSTSTPASLLSTLLIAWAGVALSLMTWLVVGALQVRRIVRRGHEATSPDWTTPLCEVADRLDLEAAPRLLLSDDIEMAFACRALEPTIVLPAIAEAWSDDRRRAVLFHELAHVKRHDLLGHTLGRLACALYWFHPLVWTAAKKLRAESERACDDLVLGCGARPSEYAQHLLDMVTSVRRHGAPVMAMPMARKKEFEGRMLAILDPAIRRAAPGRAQAALVVASLGALSLTVAAAAPVRATQTPDAHPRTAARRETGRQLAVDAAQLDSPVTQGVRDPRPTPNPSPDGEAKADPQPNPHPDVRVNAFDRSVADLATAIGNAAGGAATNIVKGIFGGDARGKAIDTARVSLLIKVLQTDADGSVRRSAAWALHDMPTERSRAALAQALRDDRDDQVREMSAWALSDFESEATANALAEAVLKDRSAQVRRTSAWALGQFDRAGGADALISAVNDSDPQVREVAIWALGQKNLTRAPISVMNALTDDSRAVRTIAAWTLGQIEDTAAVRPLTRAFETESDDHVRTTQLWALRSIGQVPNSVIETAMKSSDPELRRHGVAMLAGAVDPWPWPWPWPWPRPMP
ncbi:MAG TPA: M56 family metallopeptidase [Gemmatimonadaceae bacterium]|nr:M56 family metallopeptidase [Gemmatimonadaceae bacterium]